MDNVTLSILIASVGAVIGSITPLFLKLLRSSWGYIRLRNAEIPRLRAEIKRLEQEVALRRSELEATSSTQARRGESIEAHLQQIIDALSVLRESGVDDAINSSQGKHPKGKASDKVGRGEVSS